MLSTSLASAVRQTALKRYMAGAVKTEGTYSRQLWRSVREFYNHEISAFEFVDDMVSYVDNQFARAWRAGAREVGVDPRDFSNDDLAELDRLIFAEREHILDFAEAIEQASGLGNSIEPLRARVDLWANRYNEVLNKAKIYFSDDNLEWQLGATEEHCETCARLNGIVASPRQWEQSGYHPQGAPNDLLDCGGWRCDCRLVMVDKPRTRGGIPK